MEVAWSRDGKGHEPTRVLGSLLQGAGAVHVHSEQAGLLHRCTGRHVEQRPSCLRPLTNNLQATHRPHSIHAHNGQAAALGALRVGSLSWGAGRNAPACSLNQVPGVGAARVVEPCAVQIHSEQAGLWHRCTGAKKKKTLFLTRTMKR